MCGEKNAHLFLTIYYRDCEEKELLYGGIIMACYVVRINYYDYYNDLKREISEGRLRQGWGAKGMDIRNGCDEFMRAWFEKWPDD